MPKADSSKNKIFYNVNNYQGKKIKYYFGKIIYWSFVLKLLIGVKFIWDNVILAIIFHKFEYCPFSSLVIVIYLSFAARWCRDVTQHRGGVETMPTAPRALLINGAQLTWSSQIYKNLISVFQFWLKNMKIFLIAMASVSSEFSCWTCAVQNEVILFLFIETI